MKPMPAAIVVLAVIALSACAEYESYAGNDPPAYPYPWCADEARRADSQPLPRHANAEQRQAVRDYYESKPCQQATEQTTKVQLYPTRLP